MSGQLCQVMLNVHKLICVVYHSVKLQCFCDKLMLMFHHSTLMNQHIQKCVYLFYVYTNPPPQLEKKNPIF